MKVALVTGSSRGIGRGIAEKLVKNKYTTYLNSRHKSDLEEIVKCSSGFMKIAVGDLSDKGSIKEILQKIYQGEKKLDLIVLNIGTGKSNPGWNVDIGEYRRIFDINFFNAVSLATSAIELMKEKGGHLVFISSIAGCEPLGAPIAYSSAKTALLSFAKSLSNEVAKFNIRVNCISPGNVMFKGSTWDEKINNNQEFVEQYIKDNVPLNAFATPEDIAKAVMFLEESSFITGTNIVVDGGQIKKII